MGQSQSAPQIQKKPPPHSSVIMQKAKLRKSRFLESEEKYNNQHQKIISHSQSMKILSTIPDHHTQQLKISTLKTQQNQQQNQTPSFKCISQISSKINKFKTTIEKNQIKIFVFINPLLEYKELLKKADGKYSGQFKNKLKQGYGIMKWENGTLYQGNWRWGKIHGKGRFTLKNSDFYQGQFCNGIISGRGKFQTLNFLYQGQWKQSYPWGQGKQISCGDNYEGRFQKGIKQGFGVLQWVNSSKYRGQFSNNKLQGHGQMIWQNGNKYEGLWKQNKFEDFGQYFEYKQSDEYDNNSNLHAKQTGPCFKQKDKQKLKMEQYYKGEYKNGLKDGQGQLKYFNGQIYKGGWKKDKKHGLGIATKQNGQIITCIWEQGVQKILTDIELIRFSHKK